MPSQSVEEYIEAIYRIGGESATVNTCELAEQLGVAPPSVTTMVRRLSRDGLVKHTRYRGVSLTPRGLEMAVSMIRRHRLSERLLTDVLGVPWERVHDAACKLEHVMTGEIEERTFSALGQPERCPHGHLLEGDDDRTVEPLSMISPGATVRVVKLEHEDEEFLRIAAEMGLVPSAQVLVESVTGRSVTLRIAGRLVSTDQSVAERVWVRSSHDAQG